MLYPVELRVRSWRLPGDASGSKRRRGDLYPGELRARAVILSKFSGGEAGTTLRLPALRNTGASKHEPRELALQRNRGREFRCGRQRLDPVTALLSRTRGRIQTSDISQTKMRGLHRQMRYRS